MNRKEFVSALAVLGAAPVCACAAPQAAAAEALSAAENFKQEWLGALLGAMDVQLDEEARRKLMEASGRACARRGAVAGLRKASEGNLDKLVAALEKMLGPGNARRAGDVVHLRYAKCYCPLVGNGREKLSPTYCNCSRGWALEVFEAISGKPVSVELLSSIRRGGPDCRFTIRIGG